MLATATAVTTATKSSPATMSSSKSAWARGPPRSLSTNSPVTPLDMDAADVLESNLSPTNDTETISPVSPVDPPPRPNRNPARKPSIVDQSACTLIFIFIFLALFLIDIK